MAQPQISISWKVQTHHWGDTKTAIWRIKSQCLSVSVSQSFLPKKNSLDLISDQKAVKYSYWRVRPDRPFVLYLVPEYILILMSFYVSLSPLLSLAIKQLRSRCTNLRSDTVKSLTSDNVESKLSLLVLILFLFFGFDVWCIMYIYHNSKIPLDPLLFWHWLGL